jgi:hypothetical protein
MSKKYMIRNGFTFVDHQGTAKVGGEVIELDDDVAALHLHKLEEAPAPKKVAKVPKPAPAETTATGQEEAPAAEGEAAAGEQPAGQPASEEE